MRCRHTPPSFTAIQRTPLMKALDTKGWIGLCFIILLIVASFQAWVIIEIKQEKTAIQQLIETETERPTETPTETVHETRTTPHAPLIKKTERDTGVNLSIALTPDRHRGKHTHAPIFRYHRDTHHRCRTKLTGQRHQHNRDRSDPERY